MKLVDSGVGNILEINNKSSIFMRENEGTYDEA